MPYTRRSVLRDAALLSLAGTASASPLSLFGQCPTPSSRPPAYFNSGIRIFFSGAWLFGADLSNPGFMIAASQDMTCKTPPCHKFTYGVWPASGTVDIGPSLAPIGNNGNYKITIDHVNTPAKKADDLFGKTLANNPFLYLKNDDLRLTINTKHPTVRAISVPYPTTIIPAAFITNAAFNGNGNGRVQPGPCSPRVPGFATSHIFVYEGASSLNFADGAGNQLDSAMQDQDYHFDTVPLQPTDINHAPMMLASLLALIDNFDPTSLALQPNSCPQYDPGPDTPTSVGFPELGLPLQPPVCISTAKAMAGRASVSLQPSLFNQTLASCASGGGGVGNGGN
jgi:hypothetical protein